VLGGDIKTAWQLSFSDEKRIRGVYTRDALYKPTSYLYLCDALYSDSSVRLTNVDALTASKYEEELHTLLRSAKPLDTSNVADCLTGTGLGFYISDATRFVSSALIDLSSLNTLSC